jgi:2-oxoglutarate ferredoxin oxidoreductase subunit alpha
MAMAERRQNIPRPSVNNLPVEKREIYHGDKEAYHRYEGSTSSPMPIPGGPGSYVANGSEHDTLGDTTHLPERHVEMTERRFNKLNLLNDGTYEFENGEAEILIVPWGGSKGPAYEAYELLSKEGCDVGWAYTMYLHPMPEKMLNELKKKKLIIVPELNYMGQYSSVLRSESIKAVSITQYTGLPFKVEHLVEKIKSFL